MPITIIASNPTVKKDRKQGIKYLNLAELFSDTIQGEGISIGHPATFLRVQHCTLNCTWCDSTEVWRHGNPYSLDEMIKIFEDHLLQKCDRFNGNQHLVLTGGSPLKQQEFLAELILALREKHPLQFSPYIEIENEAVLMPSQKMLMTVDQWNNSPKLSNSGMKRELRYKPEIIKFMSSLKNSWFKFVISSIEDWGEIKTDFLNTNLILLNQVILMPEGASQEALSKSREFVAELAVRESVRFSDRLHITIYNRKTGV